MENKINQAMPMVIMAWHWENLGSGRLGVDGILSLRGWVPAFILSLSLPNNIHIIIQLVQGRSKDLMSLYLFKLSSGAEWEAHDHWPKCSSTHRETKAFPKGIGGFCARYRTVTMLGEACQLCKQSKGMKKLHWVVCAFKLLSTGFGSRNSRRQGFSF